MTRPMVVAYETHQAAIKENEALKAMIRELREVIGRHIEKLDALRNGKQ